MTRTSAVRLVFLLGGLTIWCCAAVAFSAPASAADSPNLAKLNDRLAGIATDPVPADDGRQMPSSQMSVSASKERTAGKTWRPFPGLVSKFNKAERLMHFK